MMQSFSVFLMPALLLTVFGYAFLRRVRVFDVFLTGAANGMKSAVSILPALVGLICAISMFRASGALDFLCAVCAPFLSKIGMPSEILPLALLKPVSGSGALAMIQDVFERSGPDSFSGKLASVMLGSSETTFYTLAVYYGAVKITKSRYTVHAALIADIIGIAASLLICHVLYE